jgi:putative RecB family exonuclease
LTGYGEFCILGFQGGFYVLNLTPSKMRTYLECGLKFKFQLADRSPFQQTPATAFGNFLHETLRRVYENPENVSRIEPVLRSVWNDSVFDSFADSESYFARGVAVLQRYCDEHFVDGKPDGETVGCEAFLSYIIEREGVEVRFGCKVDRLAVTDDGVLEIVDYKARSSGNIESEDGLSTDLAVFIYWALTRLHYKQYPRLRVKFINLLSLKSSAVELTPEMVAKNKAALWVEIRKIAKGEFEPRVSEACSWCAYKDQCPKMSLRACFDDLN